ncbi:phosphoenolpyruvate synthase [Paenibacillus larvae]
MNPYVLDFQEVDKTNLMIVGGKGLNLGELSRIEGVRVPEGFCVTTEAYKKIIGENRGIQELLSRLSEQRISDREKINEFSTKIRELIERTKIPQDIEEEIKGHLIKLDEGSAYAVRSSATAEDLPLASFAGQQDTYLNIKGKDSILQHVSKCWASLFTNRAVIYRIQNGFDHHQVYLSVIIQRMVFPQASGVLFTADPVTFNRNVLSIDAGFGLGEALVSGLVDPDLYKVREGKIIGKKISAKKLAIYALEEGGTEEREIEPERQNMSSLTDRQVLQLERTGRKIEGYFGHPQDIEWCLFEDNIYIVQARPITTLYPLPDVNDGKNHVYVSLGHQQMMTDEIKPLGMSFYQMLTEIPLIQAGGRLFIDVSHDLTSPIGRKIIIRGMGNDLKLKTALSVLLNRKDFMKSLPRGKRTPLHFLSLPMLLQAIKIYRKNDIEVIQNLMNQIETSIRDMKQRISKVTGDELFEFILQDQKQLMKATFNPTGMAAIIIGLNASGWINKHMEKWLGEKNAADTLSQSVSNNITSEMGYALLDVSDVVRQYPQVVEYFHHATDETLFEDLSKLEGGEAVSNSMRDFLEKYGMRCSGEIDITKPRWNEKPTTLIPIILNNIKNFAPNASSVKFKQGRLEAEQKERELLTRLEQLPGGKRKAKKTKKMISLLRNFVGYREYPKYFFIRRYEIYKKALMKEALKLVEKGIIQEKEETYYLSFEEFRETVRTKRLDNSIITKRKEDYEFYKKLSPPRVMTSEGEIITGKIISCNFPPGALTGTPVSSGIIEGRARVVLKMEEGNIEDGDILVTAFTDPSWTPLFVSVKGLVTEVGGLMTHGAVVAREYGLLAVVGVDNATKRIKDGQKIRVNGTEGYVEII